MNIGENQRRGFPRDFRDGFLVGTGDALYAMADVDDEGFEIHRDQRLVLDDQHIGGELLGDFGTGHLQKLRDVGGCDVQDLRGFGRREPLHRNQQEMPASAAA